jgi:hypothetical protein
MTDFNISDLSCQWSARHKGSDAPQPAVTFLPHPQLGAVEVCALCYQMFSDAPAQNISAKVTRLTANNVAALQELLAPQIKDKTIEVGATTAIFHMRNPAPFLRAVSAKLPTRGHPRASLHAVARKLGALA